MTMSLKDAEREVEAVRSIVRGIDFPQGIRDVVVRQAQDEDGDPIVWVLFAVDEPDRRDLAWVRGFSPFLKSVRRKLYDVLEVHRPIVGLT